MNVREGLFFPGAAANRKIGLATSFRGDTWKLRGRQKCFCPSIWRRGGELHNNPCAVRLTGQGGVQGGEEQRQLHQRLEQEWSLPAPF